MDPSTTACSLTNKTCVPCRGGVPALKGADLAPLAAQVPGWTVADEHHLHRRWEFPDFLSALAFVNEIGRLAEEEGHHPNLELTWGLVEARIWTHKIDGLTESDFILAAKIDALPTG